MTKDEMGEEIKKHWVDRQSKPLHNCGNSHSLASMCSSLQSFYSLFPRFFSIFSPSFPLQCSAQNILIVDKLQPD